MELNILIIILVTISIGSTKEDTEIIRQMMMEMKLMMMSELRMELKTEMKMSMMEEMSVQLLLYREKLEKTANELKATKEDLNNVLSELTKTKNDLAVTKYNLTTQVEELGMDITNLRYPPYLHSCGSHFEGLSIKAKTIPYTSLLYSSTNTMGGGLDIETGIFTSPHPGSYTVTWSLVSQNDRWDYPVIIFLFKNGKRIEEAQHYSDEVNISGSMLDQGKD